MRKTILARLLGATMPRTHAASFPINCVRVNSWDHRFWFDEAASIDPKAWGRLTDGRCWSRVGNEISVGFIKADDTGRTDIKKLFEELKKAEGRQ